MTHATEDCAVLPGDTLAETIEKVWIGTLPEYAMKGAIETYRQGAGQKDQTGEPRPGDALADVAEKVWIGTLPEYALKGALEVYRDTRGKPCA